jgi:integrase/recombinase XerD
MRLAEILTSDNRTRYVVLDDQGDLVMPLARYLKHLDQRGYAPNTLRSNGFSLVLFFDYLGQNKVDFQQITIDHHEKGRCATQGSPLHSSPPPPLRETGFPG